MLAFKKFILVGLIAAGGWIKNYSVKRADFEGLIVDG